MPDFPISVLTDLSTGPGMHTHLPPSAVPPAPSIGIVNDSKQSGVSVFAYLSPVTVKGGEGVSVGPGCPAGTFEVKEGMETVKVTGIEAAFFPAATSHCKSGNNIGPCINMILPGPMNRLTVWVGGPVVGMGNAGGLWGSFFKSLGLGGAGGDGDVSPADTDGSDAGANSGGTDGTGNGTNPDDPKEDEKDRIYPYEAVLIVDGCAFTGLATLGITISSPEGSTTVPFDTFKKADTLGPYKPEVTSVDVKTTAEGPSIRIEADTSTVERDKGAA
jgi:hypothetical protein